MLKCNHGRKKTFANRLQNLIYEINKKTGKQVVISIDEYDKPILDAMDAETREKNRQILDEKKVLSMRPGLDSASYKLVLFLRFRNKFGMTMVLLFFLKFDF